jgi:conjugal transfer/entry exclusion protein
MAGWYSRVSRDISQIPAAIQHFENELTTAKVEVKLKGNVEKAAAEMPGIVEQRFNQLQEIEAILHYLNIELRRLRSSFFKKYLENYQRALSSRDVEKNVDGEADVVDYEKIINEFALLRNKWLGVLKALDQKQWQITNVVKLRVAGMEDATL